MKKTPVPKNSTPVSIARSSSVRKATLADTYKRDSLKITSSVLDAAYNAHRVSNSSTVNTSCKHNKSASYSTNK